VGQILGDVSWGGGRVAHAFGRRWESERHPRPICGARRYQYTPCTAVGPKARSCLRCAKILVEAANAELRTLLAKARRGAMR
jgi:hypothetical protein